MRFVTAIVKGAGLALWASSHHRPRVAYVGGWLEHNNLGDEALLNSYKVLFPGISLYPMEGCREDATLARITRAFHSAVLAGGTIINKNNNCLARAQRMLDIAKHRFVFGTGVADPAFWQGRRHRSGDLWANSLSPWRDVLGQCEYVGVRGPLSYRTLTDAGVEKVEVIGDPVLAFADCSQGAGYQEKTLGLNVGTCGGHLWGDNEESVFRGVIELASLARNAGWKVVWFVVWPKDYPVTESAARESGTGAHIHAIYTDHEQYLSLVSQSSVFVGLKLHAVVLAACGGVPSIMLEYRPKCRDFMESIRQGHLCERVDRFKPRSILDRVLEISQNRERYASDLAEAILQLRTVQRQRAREIADRMGDVYGRNA